jgi:hypothetical protein
MLRQWVTVGLLLAAVRAVTITVNSQQERCMIVSSNDQQQFLKIDLRFERFPQQTIQEGYRLVLHNTETHEEEAFQVYEGTFRREFKLTESKRLPTQTSSTASASKSSSLPSGPSARPWTTTWDSSTRAAWPKAWWSFPISCCGVGT